MLPATFTVKKDRTVRGLTFLLHGQQYAGYLPRGEYAVIGECTVAHSDLGQVRHTDAIKLQSIDDRRDHWYVAPALLKEPVAS